MIAKLYFQATIKKDCNPPNGRTGEVSLIIGDAKRSTITQLSRPGSHLYNTAFSTELYEYCIPTSKVEDRINPKINWKSFTLQSEDSDGVSNKIKFIAYGEFLFRSVLKISKWKSIEAVKILRQG